MGSASRTSSSARTTGTRSRAHAGSAPRLGRPRFIYVWTVNSHADLREYIRIGVDGAITDDVGDLVTIAAEGEFGAVIRLATRADNPFRPGNFGYGLHVHTTDKWMAGTDANVTFTLHGSLGSASKTVNTDLMKRMESDSTNWVTIESDDLGALQSITVQRDNSGNGPDWLWTASPCPATVSAPPVPRSSTARSTRRRRSPHRSSDDTVAATRDGIVISPVAADPGPGAAAFAPDEPSVRATGETPNRRLVPSLLVVVASEI